MTEHSNISLNDIWELRKLNYFSKLNKTTTPSSVGKGIFLKTKEGDTVFDLRLASERSFLGHAHPLLLKINDDNTPKEIPGQIQSKTWLEKNDHLLITEPDAFKIRNGEDTFLKDSNKKYIVEKDLNLFQTKSLFFTAEKSNIKRVWTSHYVSFCFIEGEKTTGSSFEYQFVYYLKNYFEYFIEEDLSGKFSKDQEFIREVLSEFKIKNVQCIDRHLILDKKYSDNLRELGLLHSIIGDQIVLSFPIACLPSEIRQAIELLSRGIA